MIRPFLICCLAVLLLAALASNRHRRDTQGRVAEAYLSDSASVAFDLAPLQSGNASFQWMASCYPSQGKTAKFRIEMGPAKVSDAKDSKDFTHREEGRFMAEPGSEASVLLVDLKKSARRDGVPNQFARKLQTDSYRSLLD
jgi:hypothetical protein